MIHSIFHLLIFLNFNIYFGFFFFLKASALVTAHACIVYVIPPMAIVSTVQISTMDNYVNWNAMLIALEVSAIRLVDVSVVYQDIMVKCVPKLVETVPTVTVRLGAKHAL